MPRLGAYRSLATIALGTLLYSTPALAERVLLVRPPKPDELLLEAFNRLRAELALQGFEASVTEVLPGEDTPEKLSQLAQASGAFAGISLSRRQGAPAAEVCIADRVTGKTTLRKLALGPARDAASVLAVRSADLLRASLREFSADQPPPADVVGVDYRQPSPQVQSFAREAPARLRLDARAAALGFSQRLGPGYGPSLSLRYRPAERLWIGLLAAGPAVGATWTTEAGSASVRQELAVAHLGVTVVQAPRFALRPTLLAGVYHLQAQGEVEAPLIAQSAQVTSFIAGAGLEAELRLSNAFSIGLELDALGLSPRPAVAVYQSQYAFSWPYLAASAGVGVQF
ncbi:MAG: hypothetical protein QM756_25585 [Polyangiaceae bacterium]